MSYIEPNSTIKILKDVPLDLTYDHTIYFPTKGAQYSYFNGKIKPNMTYTDSSSVTHTQSFSFTRQSYQRSKRGWLKIQCPAECLYDCNYIMFQNTRFGTSKWFYAFLKSVEYVNENVSLIEYIIDVMQTWFGFCDTHDEDTTQTTINENCDYILEDSFIEREHSLTDSVGDNLISEDIETGEYECDAMLYILDDNLINVSSSLQGYDIIIPATFSADTSGTTPVAQEESGGIWNGVYSGLYLNVFTTASAANAFLTLAATSGKIDEVVGVYLAPRQFRPISDASGSEQYNFSFVYNFSGNLVPSKGTPGQSGYVAGYKPRNKKLYTFPYNFLYLTNFQGQSAVFPFEYFENPSDCGFRVCGDSLSEPCVMVYPKDYKGVVLNKDEKIILTGYPQCSWLSNLYMAWLAQKLSTMPYDILSGGLTAGGAALRTSLIGQAVGTAGSTTAAGLTGPMAAITALANVTTFLKENKERSIQPQQSRGTNSSTALVSNDMLDIGLTVKHIRKEFAQIIDDFFDVYGYATHRVKIPNQAVRKHWTYTKTVGCKIKGSIPAEDAKAICAIYDNGITFWKNGNEVGEYAAYRNDNIVGGAG